MVDNKESSKIHVEPQNLKYFFLHRKPQEISDGAERFKMYFYCACGLLALLIIWTLADAFTNQISFVKSRQFSFVGGMILNVIFDVSFLLLTAIILFRMSRSTNTFDHRWFESQTNRQENDSLQN